jgi:hypothetical protein
MALPLQKTGEPRIQDSGRIKNFLEAAVKGKQCARGRLGKRTRRIAAMPLLGVPSGLPRHGMNLGVAMIAGDPA